VLPVCEKYGMGVIPWSPLAGGWLSGRYRKDREIVQSHRATRAPERFDVTVPANAAKLDAADALGQVADNAGISLVNLALAFVLRHPAVTSAIIGPRTMEQLESQLDAPNLTLSDDVLDAIDKIVPPGTNVVDRDAGYVPPALSDPALRRR
jgi:aryl-alcohol dehydrogenase-like predicted oxidoreductase